MHWIGNDFIMINSKDLEKLEIKLDTNFIQKICNRNFWIWSDWLIILEKSEIADFRYRMYNPDSSEAEMCWNWIRCFMKYLLEENITNKQKVSVETWAWILFLEIEWENVLVDMWRPSILEEKIWIWLGKKQSWIIKSAWRDFEYFSVSMWNPHAVIFLDEDLQKFDLNKYWAPIECNREYFVNKVNVEFIEILSKTEINFRVYERWAWETLACWTGACASVVAWIQQWFLKNWENILVHLAWWDLVINWSWDFNDSVIMKWPAENTFEWFYYVK